MRFLLTGVLALFSAHAFAQSCDTVLESNDMMQYDQKEITVPADCQSFTILLKHVGNLPVAAMGHNVVISKTADYQSVAQDSIAAGLDNNYIVQNDDRVLAVSDLIGGGEETTLEIDLSGWDRAGDYTFFCSFPGHSAIMNGAFVLAQ